MWRDYYEGRRKKRAKEGRKMRRKESGEVKIKKGRRIEIHTDKQKKSGGQRKILVGQ